MNRSSEDTKRDSGGFSLIEAVIAILVVTIALLGTSAAITSALQYAALARSASTAKNLVVSTLEEVESLRNSHRLAFKQIANVAGVDNTGVDRPFAGFVAGFSDISTQPGRDGVIGTADDFLDPGPDLVYGTADDFSNPALAVAGFSRQITITLPDPADATLKRVQVDVRYLAATGTVGQLTGVSYLNDELRQ
jgi:type II secretory pathway pseudopilin PulG